LTKKRKNDRLVTVQRRVTSPARVRGAGSKDRIFQPGLDTDETSEKAYL